MRLASLLQIKPGVTAIIGGGGKTTLLRTLGEELAQQHLVLLCTTTKILPFNGIPWAEQEAELLALQKEHTLLCAGTFLAETQKLRIPRISMKRLTEMFEYVLVEADGSAQRPIKAHADHEPVIPPESNQTICVVGASGFGKPISEAAHRPELYAERAEVAVETAVSPITEAAVLRRERLHQRIFINQVETEERLADAKLLAAYLDCPVLAGSLHKGEYFVCSY